MAVPAVTLTSPKATRIASSPLGITFGSVNVTSYDTAHPALTALTGEFRTATGLSVVAGVSSGGFAIAWDSVTRSFKAYNSNGAAPAALLEAANGAAVGTFTFIAVGRI